MEIKASALSKTLPLNAALKDALWGVDGTVAWTAGPRAALCGVMGSCIEVDDWDPKGLVTFAVVDCLRR